MALEGKVRKVVAEDINFGTSQVTIEKADGTTVTANQVNASHIPTSDDRNVERIIKGVGYSIDEFTDLADAIAKIGSQEATLVVYKPITLNQNLTIPENICLKFLKGGKITVDSGHTLTVNGGIEAGLYQIFDGDGVVAGSPKVAVIYPEWFGAVGDGVTDDTAAIQKALDFCKDIKWSQVCLSNGKVFVFTSIKVYSYQKLKGLGGILKLKDNTCVNSNEEYYLIHNLGEKFSTFEDLIVNGNKTNNTAYKVADIITAVGEGTVVKGCKILNPPDSGIMISDTVFGQCVFNFIDGAVDCGIYVNQNVEYTGNLHLIVSNNVVKNSFTGIALKRKSSRVVVSNNIITNCGTGISYEDFGVSSGGHPEDVQITGNLVEEIGYNWREQNASERGISINRGVNVLITSNTIRNCSGECIQLSGTIDSIVANNFISGYPDSPKTTFVGNCGILMLEYIDPDDNSKTDCDGIIVSNNRVLNVVNKGIYVYQNSHNISITSNHINSGETGLRINGTNVSDVIVEGNIINASNGVDTEFYSGATNINVGRNIFKNSGTWYLVYNGNPNGVVTPRAKGDLLFDSGNNVWYRAKGETENDWVS